MEQRHWKKAGITTSLLGYGCMRLPTLPDGRIDEVRAEALLNTARDAGVNYFDTAYPYHGGDESQKKRGHSGQYRTGKYDDRQ